MDEKVWRCECEKRFATMEERDSHRRVYKHWELQKDSEVIWAELFAA